MDPKNKVFGQPCLQVSVVVELHGAHEKTTIIRILLSNPKYIFNFGLRMQLYIVTLKHAIDNVNLK